MCNINLKWQTLKNNVVLSGSTLYSIHEMFFFQYPEVYFLENVKNMSTNCAVANGMLCYRKKPQFFQIQNFHRQIRKKRITWVLQFRTFFLFFPFIRNGRMNTTIFQKVRWVNKSHSLHFFSHLNLSYQLYMTWVL